MHVIAFCCIIIAIAALPQALEVAFWAAVQLAKVLFYLLAAAFCVGFFVWIL